MDQFALSRPSICLASTLSASSGLASRRETALNSARDNIRNRCVEPGSPSLPPSPPPLSLSLSLSLRRSGGLEVWRSEARVGVKQAPARFQQQGL